MTGNTSLNPKQLLLRYVARLLHFFLFTLALVGDSALAEDGLASDERVIFFPTAAVLNADKKVWIAPIHAWVFEPADSTVRRKVIEKTLSEKYGVSLAADSKDLFEERVSLLLADNERGKSLSILIGDTHYNLPASRENGHIESTIEIPRTVANSLAHNGTISFSLRTSSAREQSVRGKIILLPDEGLSVISDIDDTVKITNVTNRRLLLENTFFKDFQSVSGMSDLYQRLAREKEIALHFVSSSPWQLYEPLQTMLERDSFPAATFHLKAFRFRDPSLLNLFKPGTKTKPEAIRKIINQHPARKYILIGDSGEQDPEVFAAMLKEFPEQIEKCLIRDLQNSNIERYKQLFSEFSLDKWQLFTEPAAVTL